MTATRSLSTSLQQMGRILLVDDLASVPDAELVGRFVKQRDEAAFTALVRRHGMVVFGVCRRVLRHEQDAEDAFQATFLVLARDAATVQRAGAVGNWLYGVAYNVARKAKAVRHRREAKERAAAVVPRPEPAADMLDDLREVLDRELHALPDKYRAPIVLCDLQGLTAREAAVEVGCPPKTLGTRLSRGRFLLARRLVRRGVTLPAGALVAALAPDASAAVPPQLIGSTVHAAAGFAAGSATVPPAVAALTQGVSNIMILKTLKSVAMLACILTVAGLSAMHVAHGSTRSGSANAAPGSSSSGRPSVARQARSNPLDHLHHFFHHVLAQVGLASMGGGSEISDTVAADDKDKPLSGVWVKKEGEMKLEFADKKVLKVSPHGKDDVILIVCEFTQEKEGLVKVKITELEGNGEAKKKLGMLLPVGTEFSFKWKVKDDAATLEELKGTEIEKFKSMLEGDFEKK
jgi:RNA polymerase sigma factor (sigma-70 family)